MTIFLTILHVIFCFTLILVILLQAGRGQGLTGASFGGGNVQSVLGTRAADFLTKATTVAAICFLLTSIGLDYMEIRKSRSLLEGSGAQSNIDLETIQKALEKVQSEEAAKSETEQAVSEAVGTVEAVSPEATEAVEALSGEAQDLKEAAEAEAADAADQVKALAEA